MAKKTFLLLKNKINMNRKEQLATWVNAVPATRTVIKTIIPH